MCIRLYLIACSKLMGHNERPRTSSGGFFISLQHFFLKVRRCDDYHYLRLIARFLSVNIIVLIVFLDILCVGSHALQLRFHILYDAELIFNQLTFIVR